MGWNFRRSLKIAPGVRVNLGKRGASVSFGIRGLRTTIGNGRSSTTVGIPGSGLSFTSSKRVAGTVTGASTTKDYKAEWAEADGHPARLAFYENRKREKKAERLAATGEVVPSGPFVCPECYYERKPQDNGSTSKCVDCGFVFSGPKGRVNRERGRFGIYVGLSVVLALSATLIFVLRR